MRFGTIVIRIQMRKRFRTAAATPGQNSKHKSFEHESPELLAIDQNHIFNTFMVALLRCWFSTKNISCANPIPKTPKVLKTLTFVKIPYMYPCMYVYTCTVLVKCRGTSSRYMCVLYTFIYHQLYLHIPLLYPMIFPL